MWPPYCLSQLKRRLLHHTSFPSQLATVTSTIRQRYVPARTANCLHNEIQKFRTPKEHSSLIPYNAGTRVTVQASKYTPICPLSWYRKTQHTKRVNCITGKPSPSPTKLVEFWNKQPSLSQTDVVYIRHTQYDYCVQLSSPPPKKGVQGERRWKINGFLVSATEEIEWSAARSTRSYLVQTAGTHRRPRQPVAPSWVRQITPTVLKFSPVSIIPPLLHTHSFIYHPHCIMFFSQYFSFPLSVSFHHCSILLHSSTTHTV